MSKPYVHRRWRDAPKAVSSDCNSCIHYHGFCKCDKYPEGIPKNIIKQSAPKTEGYNKKYCDMKELKKTK